VWGGRLLEIVEGLFDLIEQVFRHLRRVLHPAENVAQKKPAA
jgi:hypothetical protein